MANECFDAGKPPRSVARRRAVHALAGGASLCAYAFGSALFSALGIAVFLATWLVPVVLRPRLGWAALREWPLWLLPAAAFLSILWSRDPVDTVKSAAELAAFTLAAVTLARLLDARTIVRSLVAALTLVALASIVSGRGVVLVGSDATVLNGVFGSKNALAFFCGILAVTGVAGALDGAMAGWGRLFCWAGAMVGVGVGVASRSVGGDVATVLGLATVAAAMMAAAWPAGARRAAVAAALTLGGIGIAMAAASDRVADVLSLFGKSADLTGRLYLWQRAQEAIAERPWLGVGYQAYFRPQFVDAQGIYRYGGIASEAGFHFHNLYLEVATELGIVGVATVALTFLAVVVAGLRRYDRQPDAPAALILGWIAFLLPRTLLEVDFLAPFSAGWLLFAMGFVMARRLEPLPAPRPRAEPSFRGDSYASAAA